MIIYEVNLVINNDIYETYYHWLLAHIKTMLTFRGFHHAEILTEKSLQTDDKSHKNLTVRYMLDTESNLVNYFNQHANDMREEAIKKFGNQFNATRRVFTERILINAATTIKNNSILPTS